MHGPHLQHVFSENASPILCYIMFFLTNSDNWVTPVTVCIVNISTLSKIIIAFIKELGVDVSPIGWHDIRYVRNLQTSWNPALSVVLYRTLASFCIRIRQFCTLQSLTSNSAFTVKLQESRNMTHRAFKKAGGISVCVWLWVAL